MAGTLGKTALVVGGNRGLGLALVQSLSSRGLKVFATIRSTSVPTDGTFPTGVNVIPGVDLASEGGGADALEQGLKGAKLDLVLFSAGVLHPDSLQTLDWNDHVTMYKVCAMAPTFLAARLSKIKAFAPAARVLLLTSEGNMMGRLLSIDLAKEGVTTVDIHPGFMRTEMTKGAGFDEFYDSGGAVEPAEAADSVLDFAATITTEKNGQFWAPRGPRDVGQAENVMGKNLPTPLELPW
ncbi:hypothetical protein RQP46_002628 [Phenoliferia psychrophenolica]